MNPSRSWLFRKGSRKVRKIRMAMKKMTMKGILLAMSLFAVILSPVFGQDSTELSKEELVDQRFFELLELEGMAGAGAYVDSLLQVDPDNAEYLYLRSFAAVDDLDQIKYLQKSLAADSLHPDALYDAAEYEAYVNEDYPEALRYLDRYIRHYPDDYFGYLLRGDVNCWLGKKQECIEDIVSSVKVLSNEEYRYLWENFRILDAAGIVSDSVEYMNLLYDSLSALEGTRYESPALYNLLGYLGVYAMAYGDWSMDSSTLKPYFEMLKLQESKYGISYCNMLNQMGLYQFLGLTQSTIHCLDLVLEKVEEPDVDFFFSFYLPKDGTRIEVAYAYGILNYMKMFYHAGRAKCYMAIGETRRAIVDWLSVLDAHERKGEISEWIGNDEIMSDLEEAFAYIGESTDVLEPFVDHSLELGQALEIDGNYEMAKFFYSFAVDLPDKVAMEDYRNEGNYQMGLLYFQMGRKRKAAKHFKECLKSGEREDFFDAEWTLAVIEKDEMHQQELKDWLNANEMELYAYDAAYYFLCMGEKEKAIKCLVDGADFMDIPYLEHDSFWDGLREEAGFKSLLAGLKASRAELLRQLGIPEE